MANPHRRAAGSGRGGEDAGATAKRALARRISPYGYITVGDHWREGVPSIPWQPEMSWLGEPPSERQAARYEVARGVMHRAAVAAAVAALREQADELAALLGDGKRSENVARLNSLHAEIAAATCRCDLCEVAP